MWTDVDLLDSRFAEGDAVHVLGRVERFRDRLQLEIRSLEAAPGADAAALAPAMRRDADELDGFLESMTLLLWFHLFRSPSANGPQPKLTRAWRPFRRSTDGSVQLSTRNARKSMLVISFQPVEPSMLFAKDTPLLLRAAATASLAVAALLVLVPCVVLFFAVSPESSVHHLSLFQLPVTCWAAWALVSLWAALDSSRLWRGWLAGRVSWGRQGVWAMLLGALNIGASLLVVVSRASR